VDPWIVTHLSAWRDKPLIDVARDKLPLPDGDGDLTAAADEDEYKGLLKKLRRTLRDRAETVNVSRRLVDSPACVVAGEKELNRELKRMLEAAGQAVPDAKPILEVNVRHPLLARLAAETNETRFNEFANILLDHALLADGSPLANPADYVRRMNRLIIDLGAASPA
jgi:molecular chaperone HtpG